MLQPKRTKFRKQFKGRNRGLAQRGSKVSFGEFGLKTTDRGRLTARQIEAARRALTRHIKRGGKIWIRVFPDKPISKKPAEVRMGNGKELLRLLEARFKLRMQKATGQLGQTHLLKAQRHDIARVKTILKEKAGK